MRLFYIFLLVLAIVFSCSASFAAHGDDYEVNGATNAPGVNGLYVWQNYGDHSKDNTGYGDTPIYRNGGYWLGHRGCILEWIIINNSGSWQACGIGTAYLYGSTGAGDYSDGYWYPPVGTWGPCASHAEISPTPYPVITIAAPPTPATMSFSTSPYDISTTALRMVSTLASDPSGGVYYQFDYISSPTGGSGGSDSTTADRTYTDSGLGPNHQYQYRVRARDAHNQWNTYSSTASAYTAIETPSGISFGTIASDSIQVRSTNTPSGLTRGGSGLIVYNTTLATSSGWKQDNNYWSCNNLAANTSYGFQARARNGDGDYTGYCTTVFRYTLANSPGTSSFSNITQTSLSANWSANGNPAGTQYYCENTTMGTNSGWTTNTTWASTGLSCGNDFTFRVRASNGNSVVTGWTDLGTGSTQVCPGGLSVTPAGGLDASGYAGGPFTQIRAYTLTNTGGISLNWTASQTKNWVSLSQTSGTLDAGASTTVTVSIDSDANSLSPNSYTDTVTFTNATNGIGNTTRSVSLTVSPLPSGLVVTPATGHASSGIEGGPFSPISETYTLNNPGVSPLNWTASNNTSWVTLSRTSGTLNAGASTTVTVSINSDANSLAPNTYTDTVTFSDTSGDSSVTRLVTLTVNPTSGIFSVSPLEETLFTGIEGGPFSPTSATFSLENTSSIPIDWSAENSEDWLQITPTNGSLNAGARIEVTVSIDNIANSLTPATYNDTIVFTNITNGSGSTSRAVSLSVQGEITLGHMDDFEDDTNQNWFFGTDSGPSGSPPSVITDADTGNTFLMVDANGSNMDGKLVIQNSNQWTGNWTAAGIKNIEADLKNFSSQPLEIRLAIVNLDENGEITGGCASTIGVPVLPNSVDWQHVTIPVDAGAFSCSLYADIDDMLTNVSMLRLLHNTDSDYHGEEVVAQLGVDNLTAIPYHIGISIFPEGSGNVMLDPAGGAYEENEQVTVTAEAATGWRFREWGGDLSGAINPEVVLVDNNKDITATFGSLQDFSLAVSIEPEDGGTVTLDPAGGSYDGGSQVTLRAESSEQYYECGSWTVDGEHVSDPNDPCEIVVTMNANKTIVANFAAKDSDNDGICDKEEDGCPAGTDGNNDGTPDRTQPNVVSLKTADGQNYFTLVSESGTLIRQCRSAANPDSSSCPDWVEFQFGFFEFTIENVPPNGATTLDLILPTNLPDSFRMPNSYYKYGPTPDDQTQHWYRFKYETTLQVGAIFEEGRIRLHLVDNALGDDNSTVGVITDIGGPGLVDNSSSDPTDGPDNGNTSGSGGSGGGGGCFMLTIGNLAR